MLKAILLDDEPNALKSLAWELDNFKDELEVIETFTSANEALSFLKKTRLIVCF